MSNSLSQSLQRVERLFPLVDHQNIDISNAYIAQLYHENGLFYKLLHSFAGSMHMTIGQNDNGEVRGHDIQLKKIAKQIETLAKETKERIRILELGCGMGYNIKYLAKRFPDAQFIGIDITKSYIRKAKSKTKGLENVSIQLLDMDSASFDPAHYHIVYDIETVCHSQNHQQLLSKIYNCLKQDGLFILYDNFRKKNLNIDQVQVQKALTYIELAVGIPAGTEVLDWLQLANHTGFETMINTDLSDHILYGLNKYHNIASLYFGAPLLAKMLNKVIPDKLKLYSIGAYLMKYSMELGFQTYQEIVLKKPIK
jgi:cyclopropane fatty-acyl-phospholipid synthase-like methyltransferase